MDTPKLKLPIHDSQQDIFWREYFTKYPDPGKFDDVNELREFYLDHLATVSPETLSEVTARLLAHARGIPDTL